MAIEVLSKSNTKKEMARKRKDYFHAGVRLVWEFNARKRSVRIYTDIEEFKDLTEADVLTGDPVLVGFTLPLAKLFAKLDRHG